MKPKVFLPNPDNYSDLDAELAPERVVLVVALVLFSLGSLFALYEGVQKLRHPHEIENHRWVTPEELDDFADQAAQAERLEVDALDREARQEQEPSAVQEIRRSFPDAVVVLDPAHGPFVQARAGGVAGAQDRGPDC